MVDRKRYDIAASEDNPLGYATARRVSDVLTYLRKAFEEKTGLLAYQPIVATRRPSGVVNGWILQDPPCAANLRLRIALF